MKSFKKDLLIFCFFVCSFLLSTNTVLAAGNSYYLSTTGNNASLGTSTGTAWATFNYACTQLQAGDTLYVMEGTYTDDAGGHQRCTIQHSGTDGNPITITAYDNMPTFEGINYAGTAIGLGQHDYVTINKLKIKNYSEGISGFGCYNYLTNSDVGNMAGDVLVIDGHAYGLTRSGAALHDVSILNNKLHDTAMTNDTGPNMIDIIGANKDWGENTTYNIFFRNNDVYGKSLHQVINIISRNPGYGGAVGLGLRDMFFENNSIHDLWAGGNAFFSIYGTAVGVTIKNNQIYNLVDHGIVGSYSDSLIEGNSIYGLPNGSSAISLMNTLVAQQNTIIRGNILAAGIDIRIEAGENMTITGNTAPEYHAYPYTIADEKSSVFNVKVMYNSSNIVEFTKNNIFKASVISQNVPYTITGPRYYTNKSHLLFEIQGIAPDTLQVSQYPAYATPTSDYLTISGININKTTDTWDFTVTSSVPENPTTFTLETLHPNTIYSVKRDNIEISTANTDSTGKLVYSHQVAGNEFDTSHSFAFVSTGVAVPSAYTLTITSGSGSGFYIENQSVTITANAPATGKVFDKWTGDTTGIADINLSSTTIAMPASAVNLTATYKDASSVATPTFSPAAGTFTSTQTVAIASTTPSSTIYYTIDGSTPTISSLLYSSPITVSTTQTLKAMAIKSDYSNSATGSAAYTINPVSTVSTPTFSPTTGTYTSNQTVSISSATSGSTIYYTTNGNSPTISSTLYTGAISISSTTTLKAIAVKAGLTNSSIATAVYTISTGSINPDGGGSTTPITPTITKVEITKTEGNLLTLNLNVTNATSMMLSDNQSFTGSTWETFSSIKSYTKTSTQTKLYLKFKSSTDTISSVVELNIPVNTTTPPSANPYPTGTLLKLSTSPKVYVIIDTKKKWIPTPEVFEQLGYKWTEIKILTQTELNSILDYEDNLIRAINDYKVYLVVNGVKRHIPNPIIFLDYGFKWEEVKDVPQSTIDKYKNTYLIKQSGSNGIYYVNPQEIRKLIPSTEVFSSYNDKTEDIQIISKTEMESYPLSNLIKLNGSNDIYLIEGNIKKHIPNIQVFNKYKLNWNLVMSVNQVEFNFYSDGGEVR